MLLDWWGCFDGILAQMSMAGIVTEDAKKKAKAMALIGDEYATLAEYLGWREEVTYLQFQQAMLKRDIEICVSLVLHETNELLMQLLREGIKHNTLKLLHLRALLL